MTETSAADVLNALTAHIAVLNGRGVIVAVNDAWRRFAAENGASGGETFLGEDYLAVCERSSAGDCAEAEAALYGLRAVLRGEKVELLLEYPCHSPFEERWFCLRATRSSGRSAPAVVVSHEDITARKRIERELEHALARERLLARTDELTGAINRRYFFDLAGQELAVARRYHQPLSIILFDIDHFKRTNDTLGHDAGDEAIRRVARIARDHLRESDIFARYGGEEFIVLLPQTHAAEAVLVAERIRVEIAAHGTATEQAAVPTTISSGVAELGPGDDTLDSVTRRADHALYRAKQQGRNRTVSDVAE